MAVNICPQCGAQLHGNEKFCPECGARIDPMAAAEFESIFESPPTHEGFPEPLQTAAEIHKATIEATRKPKNGKVILIVAIVINGILFPLLSAILEEFFFPSILPYRRNSKNVTIKPLAKRSCMTHFPLFSAISTEFKKMSP